MTSLRLYPNYVFFEKKYKFGKAEILRKYLSTIREQIINVKSEIKFDNYESIIEKITPVPHEYDSVLASSALDACASVVELISYIEDRDYSHIQSILTLATDSVDMYIQENENLDMNNEDFEMRIATHPLMVKEHNIQKGIIGYLNKIQKIDEKDLLTLEILQENNGLGNLNL
ncbi:MAG: DUF416 family protein [Bacteroidetes bacterium]|nr:DUF416 family protein [Bacteroidota bacterium]